MTKTALVTGASGGIGGAFAKALAKRGYLVHAPVRSLSKPETQDIMQIPGIQVGHCNIESIRETENYLKAISNHKSNLKVFVLAAGTMKWDKDFSSIEDATEFLIMANLVTKLNVVKKLIEIFGDGTKEIIGIIIGSHAAHFEPGHPWRVGEEGYVVSMETVHKFATDLQESGNFRKIILNEPGRINTSMARDNLNQETIGEKPNWEKETQPEDYVEEVLKLAGL